MSVVDGDLRVYGVENLRIADGSILPRVPTGNIEAPCVVLGERAEGPRGRAREGDLDGVAALRADDRGEGEGGGADGGGLQKRATLHDGLLDL